MSKGTVDGIMIGVLLFCILLLACGLLSAENKIKELKQQLKTELEQRDFLIATNQHLVRKINTILDRQSGYKTFGYPIDLPNDIKGHVILHYDKEANFNLDQEDSLIKAHWVGVKSMSMDQWGTSYDLSEMELVQPELEDWSRSFE